MGPSTMKKRAYRAGWRRANSVSYSLPYFASSGRGSTPRGVVGAL
jgi:hypothetical protein